MYNLRSDMKLEKLDRIENKVVRLNILEEGDSSFGYILEEARLPKKLKKADDEKFYEFIKQLPLKFKCVDKAHGFVGADFMENGMAELLPDWSWMIFINQSCGGSFS